MEKERIKPCPFCGKIPKIAEYAPFALAIECECGATFSVSVNETVAIRKWNKRKKIDQETLARFLNKISQNETQFDDCSKRVQESYRDKAMFIIEELSKY